jgi:hypothetical protein
VWLYGQQSLVSALEVVQGQWDDSGNRKPVENHPREFIQADDVETEIGFVTPEGFDQGKPLRKVIAIEVGAIVSLHVREALPLLVLLEYISHAILILMWV